MKRYSTFPGLLLIVAGVLLLASNLGIFRFNWAFIWPLFLLGPGLSFEFSYFTTRRNPGVLVPGGILTLYGVFFYFNMLTNWSFMDSLWPIFILGPSVGLFQLYLFGGRDRGILIASSILGFISLSFLTISLFGFAADFIGPGALILFGLLILSKNKRPSGPKEDPFKNHRFSEEELEEYYDTDEDNPIE